MGYDGMTDYYDVALKQARHNELAKFPNFQPVVAMLEDITSLTNVANEFRPNVIIHLAAQAGVRYSLEDPRSYINSNIVGTFNVMEIAREHKVQHLMMASTSSAYGANDAMPYAELDKADHPLTIYAATKKANEAMGHSYAHLWGIPTTMFRFFTVYGPWGRPDLAYFKFTDAILNDRPIDVYNHGEMWRDFTYVGDLVRAIALLMAVPPIRPNAREDIAPGDSLSPVAPWRVVNIGNSDKVKLTDFIDVIEAELGKAAKKNLLDMQKGDVPATWANAELLKQLTDYAPKTDLSDGIRKFVQWYKEYYKV